MKPWRCMPPDLESSVRSWIRADLMWRGVEVAAARGYLPDPDELTFPTIDKIKRAIATNNEREVMRLERLPRLHAERKAQELLARLRQEHAP